jgi:hypothetical protein
LLFFRTDEIPNRAPVPSLEVKLYQGIDAPAGEPAREIISRDISKKNSTGSARRTAQDQPRISQTAANFRNRDRARSATSRETSLPML